MEVRGQLQALASLSTLTTEQEVVLAPEPIWTQWRREKLLSLPETEF